MNWKPLFGIAVVSTAALLALALETRDTDRGAQGFYDSYRERLSRGRMDREAQLNALDLSAELAAHEANTALERQIVSERAQLLLVMGAYSRARLDFQRLETFGQLPREQELARIELEHRSGELETALERAQRFTQAAPGDADGWELKGAIERDSAQLALERALARSEAELVRETYIVLAQTLRELAARPSDDPRRISDMHAVRQQFGARGEAIAEEVLTACDRASERNALALESYGRSLGIEFRAAALAQFVRLCAASGERKAALELAGAAQRLPAIQQDLQVTEFMLSELAREQRWRYGTRLGTPWLEKDRSGSVELYSALARLCYGDPENPDTEPVRLFNAGNRLAELLPVSISRLPLLYTGTAFFRLGSRPNLELARFQLSRYLFEPEPEPFPRAHAFAYRALAQSCREMGLATEERAALEGAVQLDPLGSGEDWLRLAELQRASSHGGFRGPDERLAMAIALLPQRAPELLEQWHSQGQTYLDGMGFDPERVRSELAAKRYPETSLDASIYELFRVAQIAAAEREWTRALEYLSTILERVPGFPPALDLQLSIAEERKRPSDTVQALLARVEQQGMSPELRTRIAQLDPTSLRGVDRRRLCLADPEGFGRWSVARSQAARGAVRAALATLQAIPKEFLRAPEQLELARIEHEQGLDAEALERLEPYIEELGSQAGAFETYARIALAHGEASRVRARLPAFLKAHKPTRERSLALCDLFLKWGESQAAAQILVYMDRAGKAWRGKEVLLRLAGCELVTSPATDLPLTLERLQAADTRGEAELIACFAQAAALDAQAWRAALTGARVRGAKFSSLAEAALRFSCGEEWEPGTDLGPLAPLFLPHADLDPAARAFVDAVGARGLAQLVCALDRSWLVPKAFEILGGTQTLAGDVWPHWFLAEFYQRAGARTQAQTEWTQLVDKQPSFAPAWDRLEAQALNEGQRVRLREQRLARGGLESLSAAEQAAEQAHQGLQKGENAQALAAARQAVELDPRSVRAQRCLALAAERNAELDLARQAWQQVIACEPSSSNSSRTWQYIEFLERQPGSTASELEALAKQRPNDPRVVLALVRSDLRHAGSAPAFALARAYDRMQRFREQNPVSLDSLAPGSVAEWTEFLISVDLDRAVELIRAELDLDPGNTAAWPLSSRLHAERGDIPRAMKEIVLLQRMTPSSPVLMEYVRLRSAMDWTLDGARLVCERIATAADAPPKPELIALEIEAMLPLGPAGFERILQLSSALSAEDLASLPTAQRVRTLWARALAFAGSERADERNLALDLLAQLMQANPNSRQRRLYGALSGLARAASAP